MGVKKGGRKEEKIVYSALFSWTHYKPSCAGRARRKGDASPYNETEPIQS